jgi:hypothetical protein
LTPRTVTVTSLPIITVSPTRRVRISIFFLLVFVANRGGKPQKTDRESIECHEKDK